MIKVEKITIKEFRGIRDLSLDLKVSNFAICGPNGTGKSGVVDALEFVLTGNISRLSGKGRGDLSVKAHGPHVDQRTHPEKAEVIADIVIPSLGNKKARITRTIKNSSSPKVSPPDDDVIPEPTERDSARDFLFIGQERWQTFRTASVNYTAAERREKIAKKAFELYGTTTTNALNAIYQQVETEFRKYYRFINSDDESNFEAQLIPSIGKLGFEVNFYGRGFFPPGAYHSEGHQDGMGLCLYLALMQHLQGGNFTLAVLDDVLMSVDTGHRREVCNLLKTVFPKTQFVLTTHDGIWLRHMRTAGLISTKAAIEFRKWGVDIGPSEWREADLWTEIEQLVAKNDIRSSAALLRHNLEHIAAEYCANLGARVEYKDDGRYELGDLLPSAIGTMHSLLKEAKSAANSWNDKNLMAEIASFESRFSDAAQAALVEQWAINPAIHYNEWANFSREDFGPVANAFKKLTEGFACEKCGGLLYLVRLGNKRNTLRCDCATLSFNLASKAAQ